MLLFLYLCIRIEDFDPLRGHEQVNLSSRRSLAVGALHSRRKRQEKKEAEEATHWWRAGRESLLSRAFKSKHNSCNYWALRRNFPLETSLDHKFLCKKDVTHAVAEKENEITHFFPVLRLLLSSLQGSERGTHSEKRKKKSRHRFETHTFRLDREKPGRLIHCGLSQCQIKGQKNLKGENVCVCGGGLWCCRQSHLTVAGSQRPLQQTLSKVSSSSMWHAAPWRQKRELMCFRPAPHHSSGSPNVGLCHQELLCLI